MTEHTNEEKKELPIDWLEKLNQLILDNLSNTVLTNTWLAKQLLISERSFYRNIVERTEQTPNHYIRSIRLQKAKELLQSGAFETIKEVSSQVGFKKSIYFSRLFKEEFGVYPVDILKNKT